MESNKEKPQKKRKKELTIAKAKQYQKIHIKLRIIKTVLWIVLLIMLLFSGASIYLQNVAETIHVNPWLVVLFYLLGLSLIGEIIFLPLSYYSGFHIEKKFGLSTENRLSWTKDYVKAFAINLLITIILIEFFYYLLRSYEKWWWLIAALGFMLFFILLARLAPTLLFPLFFKFKPLEDEELKDRLIQLSEKAGVHILDVKEMDLSRKSKTANAGLAGLGKSRRIILSDTLLTNFSHDEIETILAHELGHFVHKHLWKGIMLQGSFTLLGFYTLSLLLVKFVRYFNFYSISDIASFPIAMLIILVLGFILLPLANYISRQHERRADSFALTRTDKPLSFISAMEKLSELNLADPQPHPLVEFLFYSHPSINKRIKIAQEFTERK